MKKFINSIKALSLAAVLAAGLSAHSQETVTLCSLPSKLAILPIAYVGDGNETKMESMQYRLQNIAYLYLKGESMELSLQDPAETNALLIRHGINESTIRGYTPKELADLLKVEFLLTGMITQDFVGATTNSSSFRRDNDRNYRRHREVFRATHTRTRDELSTNIDLSIYNARGEKIYSKSRRSILSDTNAYKNGIHYLLKRSPLYRR
jgi:hypothetical protein